MKKLVFFLSLFLSVFMLRAQQTLIISEVADPGDNPNARFVELYNATTDTIDFGSVTYYLFRYSNGNTTGSGVQLDGKVAPGKTFVIAYNQSEFNSAYHFDPDQVSGIISGNGDDVYALYINGDDATGTLLDIYGKKGTDGTGTDWEYKDSHAVRNADIGTGNSSWTASEWTITPADVADMTPGQHTCDYPQVIPTKLVITNVDYNPQYLGWEFNVTVQAQDDAGTPGNVSQETAVQLASDGSGTFGLKATDTIPAGSNSVTLTVNYDKSETFNLTASAISGDNLAASAPVSMTILPLPTVALSTTADTMLFDGSSSLHELGIYTYSVQGPKWFLGTYSDNDFMKVSNYPSNEETEAWAILPKMTNANTALGSFVSASYSAAQSNEFKVKISTNYPGYGDPSSATWTDLSFTLPTGNFTWVSSGDIDLSGYEPEFYIAFVFIEASGHNNTIEVDSLIIQNTGTTTGINENQGLDFVVYPNPVNNALYINNAHGELQLIDNTGRIVKTVAVRGRASIDVADLQPGVYFARLTSEGKTAVRKFIKR